MKETTLEYYDRRLSELHSLYEKAYQENNPDLCSKVLLQGRALKIAKEMHLKKNPTMSLFGNKNI